MPTLFLRRPVLSSCLATSNIIDLPGSVLIDQSKIQIVEHPVGAADPNRRVAGSYGRQGGDILSYATSTPGISAAEVAGRSGAAWQESQNVFLSLPLPVHRCQALAPA